MAAGEVWMDEWIGWRRWKKRRPAKRMNEWMDR
jgi:hypothetical protein